MFKIDETIKKAMERIADSFYEPKAVAEGPNVHLYCSPCTGSCTTRCANSCGSACQGGCYGKRS